MKLNQKLHAGDMHKENKNLPSRNTCTHVSDSEESEVEIINAKTKNDE